MALNKKHKLKYQREIAIMKEVHKDTFKNRGNGIGFPVLFHNEVLKEGFVLVMERLGPSLKDISDTVQKQFTLKNTI